LWNEFFFSAPQLKRDSLDGGTNYQPRLRIPISIASSDARLAFELFAPAKSVEEGATAEVPGRFTIVLASWYGTKAFGAHEVLNLVLEVGKDVSIALFTSWLYDRLKGRPVKLRIDRTEILVEEGEIRRVLTERIEGEGK